MANIIATGMISMHDLTDAYVVTLSNYSYTFTGDTTGVPVGKSCSVVINATQGVDACSNVSVVKDKIVCPTGITAAVSGNGTSEVTITFTTNAKLTADCEAKIPITITPTKGDAVVINKKFAFAVAKTGQPGAKGDKGDTGTTGSQWYTGTAITGTSTTATVYATGIAYARVNDMYLNTSTGYTYKCTVAGNASTAKWVYNGSIKGATGQTGQTGSQWYSGTAITGTSTTATVYATGIANAHVNDMYLNTKTSLTYKCTVAGNASTAKWVYNGSIKGETGEKGEKGATGNAGADAWNITVITINGSTDTFHNNKGTAVAEAIVHKGETLMTVGDDGKVGSYGFVNWYTSTDVDAVPVGTGRTLTITADMVDGDTPYYARLES